MQVHSQQHEQNRRGSSHVFVFEHCLEKKISVKSSKRKIVRKRNSQLRNLLLQSKRSKWRSWIQSGSVFRDVMINAVCLPVLGANRKALEPREILLSGLQCREN